jgi:hypothetical protein
MTQLCIKRALRDKTRKKIFRVGGSEYALHITKNREAIVTDSQDYGKVYAVMSLDYFNRLEEKEA